MDFLRIRQKARERALQRDRQPSPASAPAAQYQPAALDGHEHASIEDALRVELDLAAAPGITGEASAGAGEPDLPPVGAEPSEDPLDEFFWREDEVAPSLPDLVAAAALPQLRESAEARREWLTFQLGTEEYAVEIEHLREIMKAPVITEVPRAPSHVVGIIMVRGEVVAVFDPRRRLGLPPADPGPRARVLVCDAGEGPRGLIVDAVSHVVRLAPSAVEPRPTSVGGVSADYITGIGRDRSRLFVLLDTAALLGDAAPGAAGEARA